MVPDLLAITPGDGRDLVPWLTALARAGLPGVLIREPALDRRSLARLAQIPVPYVVLHTRNPHAAQLGLPLHGPGCDGVSCHSEAEVNAAFAAGASYALLSPVWRPTSKPADTRPPLGLERFLAAAEARPVYALGGLQPDRYRNLRRHGARGAVSGALFGAESPEIAAERLSLFLARGL